MKRFGLFLIACLFVGTEAFAADNIVVVVNKKSAITRLTHAQVKALFLGETRYPVPGVPVELQDRERTSQIFKEFYDGVASMSPKQVTVLWSRKVFTGEAPPPVRVSGDDNAILEALKQKPEAISYIYERNVTPSVRVVYSLKERR